MSGTWKHPELGTFKHDGEFGWEGQCDLPTFDAFKWEATGNQPPGKYDLTFESESEDEPNPAAVALASRVIANQSKLPSLITKALWEDFNGQGPKSGMWWHGHLDQLAENFKWRDFPCPCGPDDLLAAMRFHGIAVPKEIYGGKVLMAKLAFGALFEYEHGVGILTDGRKVLGAGYSYDVSPYEAK